MIKITYKLFVKCLNSDGQTSWRDSGRFDVAASDPFACRREALTQGKDKADYINDFILVNEKVVSFELEQVGKAKAI